MLVDEYQDSTGPVHGEADFLTSFDIPNRCLIRRMAYVPEVTLHES